MLTQTEFQAKYAIDDVTFAKASIAWASLEAIYHDHVSRMPELQLTGSYIADRLRQVDHVHSLKFRVKDPEHVIEKVIRKRTGSTTVDISADNYRESVTDLVGVRALHLFKEDWPVIHSAIVDAWELAETPVANVRKGDPEDMTKMFADKGCHINEHRFGYRSVHYIVKSQPSKGLVLAEVQVRTIFEEGWSEIDHQIRYPYDLENVVLAQFLVLFNRLAGNADEMGSFIRFLKRELEIRDAQRIETSSAYEKVAKELKTQIENLEITKKEKEQLEQHVRELTEKARESIVQSSPESLRFVMIEGAHDVSATERGVAKLPWRLILDRAARDVERRDAALVAERKAVEGVLRKALAAAQLNASATRKANTDSSKRSAKEEAATSADAVKTPKKREPTK